MDLGKRESGELLSAARRFPFAPFDVVMIADGGHCALAHLAAQRGLKLRDGARREAGVGAQDVDLVKQHQRERADQALRLLKLGRGRVLGRSNARIGMGRIAIPTMLSPTVEPI